VRAFVTGAGGFVGAHLCSRLVGEGWEVVGTIRPGATTDRLDALGVAASVEVIEVDLADRPATAAAAAGSACDVAFLLAAARSDATAADRAATAMVNGTGAGSLVGALPARCRAVVRLGSSTEYGSSDGPITESAPLRSRGFFGTTKAVGSEAVATAAAGRGLRAVVLRAFQVYGPLDHPGRLVPAALRAARTGEVLPLTGPGRRRDWVYVDDVVEACVRAAVADDLPGGQVLNIGTGRQVTNEALVDEVGRIAGRPVRVDVGAHPGRAWDTGSWVCDPLLAARLLGWRATVDLAGGLARCWEWEPAGSGGRRGRASA
jgi:nucleoside-diphosphate-sugar epimerase